MKFLIFTEITSDLSNQYAREHNVGLINVPCYINDEMVQTENIKFYDLMRSGVLPSTSMVNTQDLINIFEPLLKKGDKILYIVFSSALSGTFDSAMKAKEILDQKYPNQLYILDSKSASLGQGLVVDYAVELRDEGKTIEEVYQIILKSIYEFCHYFTVDNLFHLYRGGRVSKTKATLGTILQLKPLLHVDEHGKLVAIDNARGRKKSLIALIDYMEQKCKDDLPKKVFISHGDCIKEAEYVANLVRERFGIEDIYINHIGPVIGAHSGPNTVAIFFRSKNLR